MAVDKQESDDNSGGPLLECLLLLANAHGISVSASSLLSGLPLNREPLPPSLFSRAAERAGLTSQVVRRPLTSLNDALFPAILLLADNQACLLTGVNSDAATATVVYPELGGAETTVSVENLETRYTGRAIYARPEQRFGARVADITPPRDGHWFWSVIKAHRGLYRDVLVAAFIINLFALAMPLFVMNVYDRVVPNFAVETLWVLALGVVLVLVADLVLKMIRIWFVDLAASRIDITLSSTLMGRVLGMRMTERPASVGSFASGLQAFESVRGFIGSSTIIAFIDLPFVLVFSLIVGLLTSWWLVLPILVGVLLCLLYAAAVQNRMHALSLSAMEASAERNAVLVESLSGLEALKTQGAEGRMQRLWERATVFLSRTNTKMRLLSGSVSSGAIWIQHTVAVAVIVVGVYLIMAGDLTQGGLIAAYLLSSRIMAPVGQSAALMMQYHQAATAIEAADMIMDKTVERPAEKQWIKHPRLAGRIAFKNVGFKYNDDGEAVLRDVSFSITA
ncbi:MAG TPA: ABC transporter transmembrane domain-containing protein, partial [Cellvibrionaceae bacterium]